MSLNTRMAPRLNIDDLRKLQQKKYRQEFGCFLAEGEHLVLELQKAALHKPTLRTSELYVTEAYQNWSSSLRKNVITDKQMAQICDTQTPQGIVALVPVEALQLGHATPHHIAHAGVVRQFSLSAQPWLCRSVQSEGRARQHGSDLSCAAGSGGATGITGGQFQRYRLSGHAGQQPERAKIQRVRLLPVRQ